MSKPIINFAHANGFPAKVYGKLFKHLENENIQVIYKEMYAHHPKFKLGKHWTGAADELIDFLDSQHLDTPVIGCGHSFGATITLNAAFKRPDLFSGIILLDPVILNGFKAIFSPILEAFNLFQYITPGHKTKGRRQEWPNLSEARSYFKSKHLFAQLDNDCFEDYLKYGLEESDAGYRLKFEVEKEVEIFNVPPYHFDRKSGKLKGKPGVIISGETTNVSFPKTMVRLANQQGFKWETSKGGHMFPLEHPIITANLIKKTIDDLSLRNE